MKTGPEGPSDREIIWRPSKAEIDGSNVARFMSGQGIDSYEDLIRRCSSDIEWFWHEALVDLGIEWYEPYSDVADLSGGIAFAKWFVGGRLNLIHNALDRHVADRGDAVAVIWQSHADESVAITYRELSDQVGNTAAAMRRAGVRRGDRVGLFMPMTPEMLYAFLAILKVGAVAVPIFLGFGAESVRTRLEDGQVKLLFASDGYFARGSTVTVKTLIDEAVDGLSCLQTVVVLRRIGADIAWSEGRDVGWDEFIHPNPHDAGTPATESMDAEEPCFVLYTSGTTGRPKGTVHTHGGIQAQVAKELGYHFDVKQGDVFFWLTDIGWMMGPWEILGVLTHGATLVLLEGQPDFPRPDRLWSLVERHRVTHLGISPTAVRVLMRYGARWAEKHDLTSLRILGSTGELWDRESYMWFFENIGGKRCPVMNISGGTEICGCFLAPLPIAPLTPCTLGGPGLGMDVDVFGEDGRPVRDEVGYLVCKQPAPSMTRGFLNDEQRYLDTYFSKWPDVWNHGDWALVDSDGFWFLHGRADDTIKIAGRRTGPSEVEGALMLDPAVLEAAAIGVPDPLRGECLVCFVVLQTDVPEGEELLTSLRDQVARAMGQVFRPRRIHPVSALPKTRSGKIARGLIRRRHLGEDLGDVSSIVNPDAIDRIPVAI